MAEKITSNKEHPLAGVVLCFTSILPEQRTELALIASQMGATHKFDLTSDVTHLLIGEVNTPKYKFVARERTDVTVLKPEWIEAVRQSWMQGGDTDIRALEEQYRCPTFMGLSLCLTGFEDMAFRNHIQDTAIAHGAEFKKDLTKSVTHLIARSSEGQKYKFATQWNIKVVTVKWFTDSIERGMVLEETLYHPLLPPEQQGAGAWNRSMPPAKEKAVGREDSSTSSNPRPRKLRRTASAKLVDQNEGIWGDIMGAGFDTGELKGPNDLQKRTGPAPTRQASIQEAKSFASESTFAEPQEPRPQSAAEVTTTHADGFLDGCYFFIYGFSSKQTKVLRQHLQFNGAQIVETLGEFSRPEIPKTGNGIYTIVSYKTSRDEIPSTDDLAFECEVVTDMWLERCLDAKALVPPESHVASTPFPRFPIPGFRGMRICSTGFSRIDLLHLSKLVHLMGASYDEYLTPNASVLICNDPRSASHEKLRHTSEWGVPAVSADWLWISIQTGQKKPFEPYIIRKPLSQIDRASQRRPTAPSKQTSQLDHTKKVNGDTPSTTNGEAAREKALPKSQNAAPEKQPQPNGISMGHAKAANGNGVVKEKPEMTGMRPPSISQSRSPSPTKEQSRRPSTGDASVKRRGSDLSTSSAAPSALDLAVSGLLKQARAANSRPPSETSEKNDNIRSRRRKPLLGRAPSHSSNRAAEQTAFSRASSIDTLNEDGCGSAVESEGNPLTRANSRSGQSFNSLLTGGRLEFADDQLLGREGEEDEDDTPAMTQLNYEDPDAVAMREKFLTDAGKVIADKPPEKQQKLVIGEVGELTDLGWGPRRSTRKTTKRPVEEDDFE